MEQTISIVIFLAVIALIVSEKVHEAAAAFIGAAALLLVGILDIEEAASYIDYNTVGVLVGMMVFVAVIKNSGMFEYIAIKSAKIAKGDPWRIMVLFTIVTAVLSAFLDNVTTVLLIGPMTISITSILGLNPIPFLLTQVLASNIGGTSTLIGDPPNIMIGSAAGFSFMDFVFNLAPCIVIIMILLIVMMRFTFKKSLVVDEDSIKQVMLLDEKKTIEDVNLLRKSVIMIAVVVVGFVLHAQIGIESGTIAVTAAAIMLFIGKQDVEEIIADIEWTTIVFFIGLFIVVGGMVETGVVNQLANFVISLTSDKPIMTMLVLLWASALLSTILNNIPFVAALIPLISVMGQQGIDIIPLWWAIALGACLGGNGTLVGASANIVIANISSKHGHPISFKEFAKYGLPVMLMSTLVSTIYLIIKFGIFY
ncbi:MAG: ArsB/NhaD family transporter [Eubacterium sp.]|nr:ArsB/NhaD family transporter [Eubacterium sp.]